MSDSCDPMDCSLLGSSVHGILQARILEQVAMLSFRGSSWPRDRTHLLQLLHCRWTLYPLSHLGSPRTQRFKTWNAGVGTDVRAEAGLDGFTVLRFREIKNAYWAVRRTDEKALESFLFTWPCPSANALPCFLVRAPEQKTELRVAMLCLSEWSTAFKLSHNFKQSSQTSGCK